VNGFFDGKYDDHIDQVMKDAGYPTTARGKLISPIAGGSGKYDPLQGAALRATRENLGLSRPQVAQRANTTVAKLARIELKGGTDDEIRAIAQALDMTAPARASSTASPTARALAEPVTNTAQATSTQSWRKLSTDEIADLQRFDDQSNQDLRLLEITRRNGHAGRPTLVDRATFESTPGTELWRGVNSRYTPNTKAAQMIRSFQTDEVPYTGLGVYGNGHYFANGPASGRNVARQYAGGGSMDGAMTRAKLRKGAKVIDQSTAAERAVFDSDVWQRRAYDLNGVNKKEFDKAMAMYKMLRDPGRWASLNGYDAMKVPQSGYTVILNRSALIIEDYVYTP
jgi:transcriptional regulator with XRE-family HTH domain